MSNRFRNTTYNIIFGIAGQFGALIFSLVLRSAFLKHIGVESLGLYSLLSEIFGIFTVLDFGVSSSVFFMIYHPMAENDTGRVRSILGLIKFVYLIRAALVALVGLIVYFFIPQIITNTTLDMEYIKSCYILFLVFNSFTYTVIFHAFFMEALQKRYIVSLIQLGINVLFLLLNIYLMNAMKNFRLYMIITLLGPIVSNLLCAGYVRRKYPQYNVRASIDKNYLKELKHTFGMALHTLSGVVIKNTDAILISILLSLTVNGYYANYKLIFGNIQSFISQITVSIKDPMRHLMAEENKENTETMIYNLTFLYFWIAGFCVTSLLCLSSPFIALFFGEQYVLSDWIVFFSIFSVYLSFVSFMINDAYYLSKCYLRDKLTPVIEVLINLVLSIILGILYGLIGIVFATCVCYIYQIIKRSRVYFRLYLQKSNMQYLKRYFLYAAAALLVMGITRGLCGLFSSYTFTSFALTMVACVVVSNLLFWVFFHKLPEYIYFKSVVLRLLNSIRARFRASGAA